MIRAHLSRELKDEYVVAGGVVQFQGRNSVSAGPLLGGTERA